MRIVTFAVSAILLFALPAFAGTLIYSTNLLGTNENPANASPAFGFAVVTIDTVAQTMEVNVVFSGLTSPATGAHIHCCETAPFAIVNVPVATITPAFTGFPLGATSGTYDHVFDLTSSSTYNNPSFLTAHGGTVASEEAALLAGIDANEAYLNIHTNTFPGGEIRGILAQQAPEPGTLLLTGALLGGLLLLRRRQA